MRGFFVHKFGGIMNKIVLCSGFVFLFIFGGLLLTKEDQTKIIPYYIQTAPAATTIPPSTIYLEIPSIEQLKKDLSGKTVVINDRNHQFVGPELSELTVISSHNTQNGLSLDVKICADATIVERISRRYHYTRENVCGSLRVYYDKKDNQWTYRMVENLDLQKVLVPNSRSSVQIYKYR